MSTQKLENYNNKEAIREEVTILTNILQDVAREMMSEDTFAAICQLEELSVKDDYSKLIQIIGQLTNDELADISRYFAVLPLLINISEDVDLAFEINHQNNLGQDYLLIIKLRNLQLLLPELVREKQRHFSIRYWIIVFRINIALESKSSLYIQ